MQQKKESLHHPLPPPGQVGPAMKFVARIEKARSAVWGTEEEKSSHRANVWGMCHSLGEPHLMLFLSVPMIWEV